MSRWTVKSVINNNVVSARNERNQERILTGRGIGFHAKPGDTVDASRVEKEFFLKSKKLSGKLYALLAQTPEVYMEITDAIVKKAEEGLGKELNETVYLNLIDHLSFAVSRMKQGMNFRNVLLWEIRNFYPKEYEAALYGLALIEEKTGEKLPEDEAGEPEDVWTYKQRQYDKLAAALRESLDLPAIYRILDRGLEKGGAAR